MAFFDKLNAAAKNAAKTAADVANDAIGSGKIAVKIMREETQIEQQYEKIGEYFYKKRKEGMEMPPEIEEYCVAVDIALASIKELKEVRADMRDRPDISVEDDIPYAEEDRIKRICNACGSEIPEGVMFCVDCGSKAES